jgi:hypothetical protein
LDFRGFRAWIANDLNVTEQSENGSCRVTICCEDGGDFPGDWDDLVLAVEW